LSRDTERAIWEFQKDHNLPANGSLGPETLEKIRQALRERARQVPRTEEAGGTPEKPERPEDSGTPGHEGL